MSGVPVAEHSPTHLSLHPHHPQIETQTSEALIFFFWIRLGVYLEQAFLSSLWVFNPSPLLLPRYHGEDNTKCRGKPSYHYPFALPFPSNTVNISTLGLHTSLSIDPQALGGTTPMSLYPIPRSKQRCALGRSLTLGYNEGSEGSALVGRCWP